MANDLNDLCQVYILPKALKVLREACVMPALVFTDYQPIAEMRNKQITIPGPQVLGEAEDMAAAIAGAGTVATALTDPTVTITLSNWKYKQFEATDKDMLEAPMKDGVLPSAAEEAVRILANDLDKALLALYKDIPYFYGTPGVTPSNVDDIINVRKVLQNNKVPLTDRRLVVDTEAEAKFLISLKDAGQTGTTAALREASMGRLSAFDIYADQLVSSHAVGTFAAGAPLVNGAVAAEATTMAVNGGSGTETILEGDIFTVAGAPGQYVCTAKATAAAGAIAALSFYPEAPAGGFADKAAVTILGNHTPNLAFHRDAFALVMRPIADDTIIASESSTIAVQTDPVSGIPLRLETWRESKYARRQWRFDILYGVKTLRPELAARLIG